MRKSPVAARVRTPDTVRSGALAGLSRFLSFILLRANLPRRLDGPGRASAAGSDDASYAIAAGLAPIPPRSLARSRARGGCSSRLGSPRLVAPRGRGTQRRRRRRGEGERQGNERRRKGRRRQKTRRHETREKEGSRGGGGRPPRGAKCRASRGGMHARFACSAHSPRARFSTTTRFDDQLHLPPVYIFDSISYECARARARR